MRGQRNHLLRAHSSLEERFSGALSVHGLSLKEMLLLLHLEREPLARLTRVALAKRLNISASTVTRMAQPLEKCGFVSRQTDARDALTFIFGPIGLLVFMAVRYFWMTPPQRA